MNEAADKRTESGSQGLARRAAHPHEDRQVDVAGVVAGAVVARVVRLARTREQASHGDARALERGVVRVRAGVLLLGARPDQPAQQPLDSRVGVRVHAQHRVRRPDHVQVQVRGDLVALAMPEIRLRRQVRLIFRKAGERSHASSAFLGLLEDIHETGVTVLFATHDRFLLDIRPRRVVVLDEGKATDVHGGLDAIADSNSQKVA